jgi:hypothetical protein
VDTPALERGHQRRFVDDAAARDVDEHRLVGHVLELGGGQQVHRRGQPRHGDYEHCAAAEDVREGRPFSVCVIVALAACDEHLHAERARDLGYSLACAVWLSIHSFIQIRRNTRILTNSPIPQNAHHLLASRQTRRAVRKLHHARHDRALPRPRPVLGRAINAHYVASRREVQRHDMVRHRLDIRARTAGDANAALATCVQVDGIRADGCDGDELQVGRDCFGERFGVDAQVAQHDDGGIADARVQLVGRGVSVVVLRECCAWRGCEDVRRAEEAGLEVDEVVCHFFFFFFFFFF